MDIETTHDVYIGDSRAMMNIDDSSVQLVITSPPYWQIKDYGTEEQIGFNDSYQEYITKLNHVWYECHRILEAGCRLCINVGHQFAQATKYGRYKIIPIRTEIIKFCESIGFDFMGEIIWQKKTNSSPSGGGAIMGSYPYPRNGIINIDFEFILLFKKQGRSKKIDATRKELSIIKKSDWQTWFSGHWAISGVRQKEHSAMFPEEIPRRLIQMFSYVGDIIVDPFVGSGTTIVAAGNLYRNSKSYEINSDYIDVIKNKTQKNNVSISIYNKLPSVNIQDVCDNREILYTFVDYINI